MKKSKPNYYTDIIGVLTELKTLYPSYTIGNHLATALDDYGDIWGVTDKEFLYALNKYKAQMQMDVPHEVGDEEVEEIMKDAMNLSISKEPEDDYGTEEY